MSKELFNNWFDRNSLRISIWLAIILSVGSFLFFYFNGQWNLVYVDASAHLNAGRKIFDNLTPGFAQLGGLWLPLLHLLMIPTIWNDFMWQSGLSGYLVSGPAFILSVYFIFKTIDLLFQDKKSAFLGALVYMTNVNIIYLQTAAMMESLFNLTIIGSIYFISKWAKKDNISDLILGGIFVAASTLVRYEGYGVFIMAVVSVSLILFWKNRKKIKIIEGNFLLFISVAGLGIVLWAGYLGAIFGDPLHWMHSSDNIIGIEETSVKEASTEEVSQYNFSKKSEIPRAYYYKSASQSFLYLLNATSNANGVLLVGMSLLGLILIFFYRVNKYSITVSVLIALGPFFFLFASMYGGKASVMGPFLWGDNIFDKSLNLIQEYGVRYTLSLLPFVAIFSSVISLGKWYKKLLLTILIFLQIGTVFIGPLFLMSNLPLNWRVVYGKEIKFSSWLRDNYDSGMILTSALSNESGMFWADVSYENYIYEGNGKYFEQSLNNPAKYANWVVMGGGGIIKRNLADSEILSEKFNLVYDDGGTKIYKIKDKPEIDLLEKLDRK